MHELMDIQTDRQITRFFFFFFFYRKISYAFHAYETQHSFLNLQEYQQQLLWNKHRAFKKSTDDIRYK